MCWGRWQNTDLTSPTGTPALPISSRIPLVSICCYQGWKSPVSVKNADFHGYESQNAHSDQTPTDLIYRLKSFSPAAYCIFMIILLLRLTCSMHTFFKCWSSNVHVPVYAWSFWRTLEVNQYKKLSQLFFKNLNASQFNLLWWNWTIETWH